MCGSNTSPSRWNETTQANAEREPQKRGRTRLSQGNADGGQPVPGLQCIEQLFEGQSSLNRPHPTFDRIGKRLIFVRNLFEKSLVGRSQRFERAFVQAVGCGSAMPTIKTKWQRIDPHLLARTKQPQY